MDQISFTELHLHSFDVSFILRVQDPLTKSLLAVSEGLSRCPLELGVVRHYGKPIKY